MIRGTMDVERQTKWPSQKRERNNVLFYWVLLLLIVLGWAILETKAHKRNPTHSNYTNVANSTPAPVNSSKPQEDDSDLVEKPDADFEMRDASFHSRLDEYYHRNRVDRINNNPNSTWKAKYHPRAIRVLPRPPNAFQRMNKTEIDEMADKIPQKYENELLQDTEERVKYLLSVNIAIPTNFDARLRWPSCWATHQIYDQAGCGSCWAVAATSVMSDRVCISSNFTSQIQISAEDLTSCCWGCGGCMGNGNSIQSFMYWKETGIVSGGSFGTHHGCRPYSLEPCRWPCKKPKVEDPTPECERKCIGEHDKEYNEDIIKSSKAYWLRATTPSMYSILPRRKLEKLVGTEDAAYVTLIQKEILLNGPVVGCFNVHESLQYYVSGVYAARDLSSLPMGGHCSKLLGWGEENGAKYWLYANSWGRNFAEKGFFRIAFDEIPLDVVAGHI